MFILKKTESLCSFEILVASERIIVPFYSIVDDDDELVVEVE